MAKLKIIKKFNSKRNRVYLIYDSEEMNCFVEKNFARQEDYMAERAVYERLAGRAEAMLVPKLLESFDSTYTSRYAYIEGITVLEQLMRYEDAGDVNGASAMLVMLLEWLTAFYDAYDSTDEGGGMKMALVDLNLRNFIWTVDQRVVGIDFEAMDVESRMVSVIRILAMYRQCSPVDSTFKQNAVKTFLTERRFEMLGELGSVTLTKGIFDVIYDSEVERIRQRRAIRVSGGEASNDISV
jgi:hypothetical protein